MHRQRRRAPEAILADIDAYIGVYPVVSSTVQTGPTVTGTNSSSDGSSRSNSNSKTFEEGEIEDDDSSNGNEEDANDVFKQKYPELAALLENIPEASVSLWLVPAAHACVSGVTDRAEQDEDRSEPRRGPSLHEDPEAPHARTIGEAEGKPIRLDLQELLRGSGARQAGAQRESSWLSEALQGRALRVALDVVLGNCRPVRRTGTVLLRDLEQARSGLGWPVSWDNPQWFKGARVGLNFTHETGSCQHAALSPGLQAEGHMDIKRRPFLYLVWVCEHWDEQSCGRKESQNEDGTNRGGRVDVVAALGKQQHGWEGIGLTTAEKRALGVGCDKREFERRVMLEQGMVPVQLNRVEPSANWMPLRSRIGRGARGRRLGNPRNR